MGNYENLEADFIERTLALISQYEIHLHKYRFEEQYNYTLLINCLLGLIVLPKERIISYLPNQTIFDNKLLSEMGIEYSRFNTDIKDFKSLIISLRHSIAHFHITIESVDDSFLIDNIVFMDVDKGIPYEIARFKSSELLPFVRYYSTWLLSNLYKYKK